MENVLAIILAGGRGERLGVLSQGRTKPAVSFGGKYRIIDFTLSNCVNSGISRVTVLTQYQPLSLIDHIGIGTPWDLDRPGRNIRVIQPYLAEKGRGWYKGTADAVYQNLRYIEEQRAEYVLVLSGDHVYRMDYSELMRFHSEANAEITVAATYMPEEELSRFGTLVVDEDLRVVDFQEKVKRPRSNLASMGVYLFRKDALRRWLEADAANEASKHDFGKDIIPSMIGRASLHAYVFQGYWRDVGTIDSYWLANMELLNPHSRLFADAAWPLHTTPDTRPPAFVSPTGEVADSMIASGCVIEGRVLHSILSPGVRVAEGAFVKDSIIMADSTIGPNSIINRAILDKEVTVEAGCYIGWGDDKQPNRVHPRITSSGITVVGKKALIPFGTRLGHNCLVYEGVGPGDFPAQEIPSGETVVHSRRSLQHR